MTVKKDRDQTPPWQDMPTLCRNICASPSTVTAWVSQGILPKPRRHGGKLMWKWSEVDDCLTGAGDQSLDAETERITENVRRDIEGRSAH